MTNVWLPSFTAKQAITTDVLFVHPETPTRTVAKLLPKRGISAALVVDLGDMVIGMVDEADIVGREIRGHASDHMW